MKKRAVSGVVVTVILIALSVSLISIIWAIIVNMVDTNLDNTETRLTEIELNIIDGSVLKLSDKEFSLKLDRGYDENEIVKLIFLIETKEGETEEKIIQDIPKSGDGKPYQFNTDDFSIANSIDELKKISIAPVIKFKEKEKTLTITDTHNFDF